jgi:hypothetical protein
MTTTMSNPAGLVGVADDRIVVISEPRPGTIVELTPGSQLAVRFRPGLGASRWQIAELPGYLVPLAQAGHEFQFLVFGCPGGTEPLRLERRHPERDLVREVCELLVVPVSDTGAGTSRSASPRTA